LAQAILAQAVSRRQGVGPWPESGVGQLLLLLLLLQLLFARLFDRSVPMADLQARQARRRDSRPGKAGAAAFAVFFASLLVVFSASRARLATGFTTGVLRLTEARQHSRVHVAAQERPGAPAAPPNVGRLGHGLAPFNSLSSPGQQNALQHLRGVSAVIPDEFSLKQYEEFGARLAFVSSRTVLEALESESWPGMAELVQEAQQNEQCAVSWGLEEEVTSCFEESLFALVGKQLLAHPGGSFGLVSTEIPAAAMAAGPEAVLASGLRIIAMYRDLDVAPERVLLRCPASYEGLRAAEALSRAGLATHVTHVYSLSQAALAVQAGAFAVQVYAGRVDRAGGDGIGLARQVHNLLKDARGRRPALIAASLTSLSDVSALAGADYLLVPPALLRELRDNSPACVGLQIDPTVGIASSRSIESAANPSGFLLSREDFEASMPERAAGLLTAGLERYKQQAQALDALLLSAQQYL